MRGVPGDDPEGGAGSGVPRSWLVTTGSGGSETARRALRPVLQGARCTSFGGNAEGGNADPTPKTATVERREARVPPTLRDAGCFGKHPGPPRDARAFVLLCDAAGQPVLRKHRAPVGAPPTPRFRGWTRVKTPGRNAPREGGVPRVGLFDMVKKVCGHALASAGTIRRAHTRMGGAISIS